MIKNYFASKTSAKIPAANGADAKEKIGFNRKILREVTNQMFQYDHRCMNREDQWLSNMKKISFLLFFLT